MKKILIAILFFCFTSVQAQKRNDWGAIPGAFYPTRFQHLSDLPATSNPPMFVIVADSTNSSTVPTGAYIVDSIGRHPFVAGSGGGGGGGMSIGGTVASGTSGSILFVDPSGLLGQNNTTLFWDSVNKAEGIGNNSPVSDEEIFHAGTKTAGLTLSNNGTVFNSYLDFVDNRGTRGSPTSPSANDSAGTIRWRKWNGSVQETMAQIRAMVSGTPSTTNIPGELHFSTNTSATPSVLTRAMLIDNTQTTNILHAIIGSASNTVDGNAQFSLAEIMGTEPNSGFAGTLMLNDNTGQTINTGSRVVFGTLIGTNVWTGGAVLHGYRANSIAGNYSAGFLIQTRVNGSPQAEAIRWNELQHTLIGGLTADSASWLQIQASNSTTASQFFTPGTTPTTLLPGMLWYVQNGGGDSLNFYHNGVTTNLLASGGGGTPNIATVLNSANQSANATWTLGGHTVAFSGLSHDTTNTYAPFVMNSDSTLKAIPWAIFAAKLNDYLPSDSLFVTNGLTQSSDTVLLGGTLNRNTSISAAGFTLGITGGNIGLGTNATTTSALTIGIANYNSSYGTGLVTSGGTSNDPITSASGTVITMAANRLQIPTFTATNTGVVYTNAATLYIDGPPTAGTNVTETNKYPLYVAGTSPSYFGGPVVSLHLGGNSSTPTTTSLGANVTSATVTGNDNHMQLVVVTSGNVSGTVCVINFASAWSSTPVAVICSANSNTGTAIATTTGGYISLNATSTTSATMAGAFNGAGTYTFNIICGN